MLRRRPPHGPAPRVAPRRPQVAYRPEVAADHGGLREATTATHGVVDAARHNSSALSRQFHRCHGAGAGITGHPAPTAGR